MSDQPFWERRYDRRGFVAVSAMTAFLAACGGSTTAEEPRAGGGATTATEERKLSGELFYYNWADYVNPDTYEAFEQATGVTVKKDFYASNEDLQAKLQAGARGFDLVVPTGYMINILIEAGLLSEIDWSQLPTVQANIDPKFLGLPFDPDDRYSVPKDWGTTGYIYRNDKVKEKPTSWRDFFDLAKGPYSGKVTVLDSNPEVIGAALVMHGHSYNTDDEAELEQAKEELIALKPHLLAITSSEYKQMLASGRSVMGLGWNGDGFYVNAETKGKGTYVVAEEGGEFWVDSYAIPVGANNPDAAHAWIDYVYDAAHNATETSYTYYGSPLKRELLDGVLDDAVLNDEAVFPKEETLAKLEANNVSPEGTKLRDRIWTEFKAA